MTSKYIAASHSFQEQQYLERPIAPKIEDYPMGHETYFNQDWYNFNGNLEIYNDHIESLRLIPCRPGDKWQEGILYEEGEDYTVVTFTPSDCQPSFFVPPDDLPIELMIIPFPSLSSEPPTTEQTELWKEVLKRAYHNYGILYSKKDLENIIVNYAEKYSITRKEEVPEAFYQQFGEWTKITFPDAGPVEHLKKLVQEAWEAAKAPDDISEYADCLMCLLAAAFKKGYSFNELMAAAQNKFIEVKERKWQKQDDGTYQHIPQP